MILACHNISKAFGEQVIVKSGSFHIEDREKTALIGPNGAGKSTILKMIMKELDTDSGDIILTKGKTTVICHSIRSFQAETQFWKS